MEYETKRRSQFRLCGLLGSLRGRLRLYLARLISTMNLETLSSVGILT